MLESSGGGNRSNDKILHILMLGWCIKVGPRTRTTVRYCVVSMECTYGEDKKKQLLDKVEGVDCKQLQERN